MTFQSPLAPVNALTVDVEDWHQLAYRKLLGCSVLASQRVVVNTHLLLDLMAEYNVRATFFVLGTVAEQFPELVMRISKEGHEVASHGFAHHLITQMSPGAFRADLRRSIDVLEEIVQEPILGYRAPQFSLNGSSLWALELMAAAGLHYDSSVFPIRHPRYGIPSAPRHPHKIYTPSGPLVEFPLTTARVLGQNVPIAGGGYMRVLPLAFIRWGFRTLNRQGHMAVLYIHPYEFDEEWLDLPVPTRSMRKWLHLRLRALRRNLGRGQSMQAKLRTVLRSFSFASLREVMVRGTEWQDSDILSTARQAIRPAISTGSPPP